MKIFTLFWKLFFCAGKLSDVLYLPPRAYRNSWKYWPTTFDAVLYQFMILYFTSIMISGWATISSI